MRPYRVLIVDDQCEARRVVRAGLETLRFEMDIVDVPSGEEAILVNTTQSFDLLVVDLRLPGMSGFELIERLRLRNPHLRIILMTGMTDSGIRENVARSQVDAYFFKPVKMGAFIGAVRKCLGVAPDNVSGVERIPSSSRPSPAGLTEKLEQLRISLRAMSLILIGEQGEIAVQAGAVPAELDQNNLVKKTASVLKGTQAVADLTGTPLPNSLTIIYGGKFDFALKIIGRSFGLLLVCAGGVIANGMAEVFIKQMDEAATEILALLNEKGEPIPSASGVTLSPPEDHLHQSLIDSATADLDEIFRLAKEVKSADVDAFWETAAKEAIPDELLSSDTIPFEQARRLGLELDER